MASRGSSGIRRLPCCRCGIHTVVGRGFIQPLPLAGIIDGAPDHVTSRVNARAIRWASAPCCLAADRKREADKTSSGGR